jgi:FlaA1/EpsC-like NDP-sugar epimerase
VCERSPLEAIHTNVIGVQNVIQASIDNGVERLIFTSSDKAVNPTNVMGTSKLMGERLVTASATDAADVGARLLSTRFGNVLGSRGSVIPIFCDQIRRGGPVTITDPMMTRFIMSLDAAVDLVIDSMIMGQSGDVLITKMPAVRIVDLAEVMIEEFAPRFDRRARDVKITIIGPRPGEKLYEELMNEEETRRAIELDRYYVVRPAAETHVSGRAGAYPGVVTEKVMQPYNSENVTPLTKAELKRLLIDSGLINPERRKPRRR